MSYREELNSNLFDTAARGDAKACRLFIERGANVHATDSFGWTPLHLAAERGHAEVSRVLIEQGANVNVITPLRLTPLHFAALNDNLKVCQLLIQAGADVHAANQLDWTPLHLAAYDGHLKVCQLLIQAGADVNAVTRYNETPLDLAIRNHAVGVLEYFLLNRVVNFHVPDHTGRRPWDRITDDEKEVLRRAVNNQVQAILALRSTDLPKEINGLIMRYL